MVELPGADPTRRRAAAGATALVEDPNLMALVGQRAGCQRAGGPRTDHCDPQPVTVRPVHAPGERAEVQSEGVGRERAGSHGAEDGLRGRERPVELPEAPEDAAVRARVTPIQGVAVVQVHEHRQGLRGTLGPLQQGLAPGHTQVVVELAVAQ